MAWRFRKTFGLGKGLRLSVGRRSAGLLLGGRGASIGIGTRGTSVGASLPGTGLSVRKRVGQGRRRGRDGTGWIWTLLLVGLLLWWLL